MIARLYYVLLFLLTLACLTYGAWHLWSPPAGILVLGACLWADLYLGRRLRGAGR